MEEDPFKDNATLVHEAARRGYLEILEVLVEHGAVLNGLDGSGNTPLHLAALNKHIDTVIFLVQKGCPLNVLNDEGDTAIRSAVKAGHFDIVRYLHRQGAILGVGCVHYPMVISILEVSFGK